MPRNYVDNPGNRSLGRVGMPVGSAVHSRNSSGYGSSCSGNSSPFSHNAYGGSSSCSGNSSLFSHNAYGGSSYSSSSSGSTKTYVDNAQNRQLGRVGMEYGTAVHSSSSLSSSGSTKTYVDNAQNRQLGRVDMEHGTAVHSRSGSSSNSRSGSTKTYVDNAQNQRLGRVGMEYGTAGHSRSDSSRTSVDCGMKPHVGQTSVDRGKLVDSTSGHVKRYVDNALNRKLGRVGMELGTAVHSRASLHQIHVSVSSKDKKVNVETAVQKNQDHFQHGTTQDSNLSPKQKVYVDNAYNRKHKRVGLPLGSVPISRKTEVYRDTPKNRELGRALKPWGTCVNNKKLASLYNHLEQNFDEDVPAELDDLSDDAVSSVLEFMQRQKAVENFLENTTNNNWSPYEHTVVESIKGYRGTIIDFNKLEIGPKIGHGGFGEVYFASLDGEAVAVKILKFQQVSKKNLQQFINEMDLFVELDHPNIVTFLGACTVIPNLAIVMEFMDMSLYNALHMKDVEFTVDEKLEIMKGVTKGLAYLHYKNIAHCDLKTQNVLLINVPGEPQTDASQPVRAKITDFGLSKMKSDMITSNSMASCNIGTPRYMAPEMLRGEILIVDQLKKADVYSMGLLIWELAIEEPPFESLNYNQLKAQVGEKGLTPASSDITLDGKLHGLLCQCWSMDPDNRPSSKGLAEAASTLTTLLEEGEE